MTTENNIWLKCLNELSASITEKDMRMWIAPLKVKKMGNGLKLLAPNKFMKDEVEKNFLGEIPINSEVGKSGDNGKPIVEENPDHEISKIYFDFAKKIKSTYL